MMIAGAFAIGLVFAIALVYFILDIKKHNLLQRAFGIIIILLAVYGCSLYISDNKELIWLISGALAGIAATFSGRLIFVKTRLHAYIINASGRSDVYTDEEDFMNTKKGKIITVLVVILVVYSIISTACILRLNQKINSMVVITDELREEISK